MLPVSFWDCSEGKQGDYVGIFAVNLPGASTAGAIEPAPNTPGGPEGPTQVVAARVVGPGARADRGRPIHTARHSPLAPGGAQCSRPEPRGDVPRCHVGGRPSADGGVVTMSRGRTGSGSVRCPIATARCAREQSPIAAQYERPSPASAGRSRYAEACSVNSSAYIPSWATSSA